MDEQTSITEPLVEGFRDYLVHEKRLSKHTQIAYLTDLEQLSIFLTVQYEEADLVRATPAMLRSWVVSLVDAEISPVSINRKMATLRAFYRFLRKRQKITSDPTAQLVALKTKKAPPSFVDEKAMASLFTDVEFPEGFEGIRDRLVLEILYGAGLRLSELTGLTRGAVSLSGRTFRVLGKRSKERIIPFSQGLAELLSLYLSERGEVHISDPLLVTDQGKPVYPVFVQRLVKKYLSVVTSLDKKSPHVLRHTYATHLLNRGADLNAIKELLGHANLAATQIYTHNAIDKLKKSYKQAHPKA